MTLLLDTGPWVALLCRNDTHHNWANQQFRVLTPPLLSCEVVVAETCFLLKRSGLILHWHYSLFIGALSNCRLVFKIRSPLSALFLNAMKTSPRRLRMLP